MSVRESNPQESQQAVFATGFGGITDLQVGPEDGDLYALSFTGGAIYRMFLRLLGIPDRY
jgi:hypothetical protein